MVNAMKVLGKGLCRPIVIRLRQWWPTRSTRATVAHSKSLYGNADSQEFTISWIYFLPSLFPALRDMALRYRCIFGSTYICEKSVSYHELRKKNSTVQYSLIIISKICWILLLHPWITSQREGYPKTLIRIKSGVFHVNASLIRHFWFFFFAINSWF